MPVTLDVSKDERSREVSSEQLVNIPSIRVTCEVSKEERSSEVKEEQD